MLYKMPELIKEYGNELFSYDYVHRTNCATSFFVKHAYNITNNINTGLSEEEKLAIYDVYDLNMLNVIQAQAVSGPVGLAYVDRKRNGLNCIESRESVVTGISRDTWEETLEALDEKIFRSIYVGLFKGEVSDYFYSDEVNRDSLTELFDEDNSFPDMLSCVVTTKKASLKLKHLIDDDIDIIIVPDKYFIHDDEFIACIKGRRISQTGVVFSFYYAKHEENLIRYDITNKISGTSDFYKVCRLID